MTQASRPPLPYDFMPPVPAFTVVSEDVTHDETLTATHLYEGENLSPQLRWEGFPPEAKSFAVTCFDPDAPTGSGFWHWVLFDIPASVTELPRGAGNGKHPEVLAGAVHARNDFGSHDFGGAAPPPGDPAHRYVFAVHALDVDKLGVDPNASPAVVGFNLRFHALARAVMVPVFGR